MDRLSLEVQSDSGKSMAEIALDQNFLSVIFADPISYAARKPASLNMTAFGGFTVQDSGNGRMKNLSFGIVLQTISSFESMGYDIFYPISFTSSG